MKIATPQNEELVAPLTAAVHGSVVTARRNNVL